jgi:hypothetical protein
MKKVLETPSHTGYDGHIFSNHMVLRKSDESCICDHMVEYNIIYLHSIVLPRVKSMM